MSYRKVAVLALAVAAWPMGAPGQEPTPTPTPAPTPVPAPRTRVRVAPPGMGFGFVSTNRARIGVVVNVRANAEQDRLGAGIEAVTPGGPAAQAGLKAGDIVIKFNNTSLAGVRPEDAEDSGPGMKLIELARALEPGDTVRLEYRRGSETKRATVVAAQVEARWSLTELPRMEREFRMDPESFRMRIEPGFGGVEWGLPWSGLDLVTVNPDLGEYFGTREGVLVIKAQGDSTLPLKSGDVILSIDGRKPTSPSHAIRILRSYEAGEVVRLEILRKRNRQTLNWTVPEREPYRMPMRYREREEPA
ncbi:MAG: PDZ domain-containing protein [Acidimicrobiales bacterium]